MNNIPIATGMVTPIMNAPAFSTLQIVQIVLAAILLIAIIIKYLTLPKKDPKKEEKSNYTTALQTSLDMCIIINLVLIAIPAISIGMNMHTNATKPSISMSAIERHYNVKMLQTDPDCNKGGKDDIFYQTDNQLPETNQNSTTDVVFRDTANAKHKGMLVIDNGKTILWLKQNGSIKHLTEYKSNGPTIKQAVHYVRTDSHKPKSQPYTTILVVVIALFEIFTVTFPYNKSADGLCVASITACIVAVVALLLGMVSAGSGIDKYDKDIESYYGISSLSNTNSAICTNCHASNELTSNEFNSIDLDLLHNEPTSIATVSFIRDGKPQQGIIRSIDHKATLYVQKNNTYIEYQPE